MFFKKSPKPIKNWSGKEESKMKLKLSFAFAFAFAMSVVTLTAAVSDFSCVTNADNTITITGYNGSGGAVVIPSTIGGKAVVSIGIQAFYGCSSMTGITIPNSVTSIRKGAFVGCSGLTSVMIPDSVTYIGSTAFASCIGLTSIIIPDSVTYLGDNLFLFCDNLTAITVDEGNSVYSSVTGILFNKDQTALLEYPPGKVGSYTISNCVTRIGVGAFVNCTNLFGITIPNSVTSIGHGAFVTCNGLNNVTIPDSVTSIEKLAFSGCANLVSVTVGDSVTNIGDDAFSWCNHLTSITIPDSVTRIGSNAFYSTRLTNVTIGNGVTYIGDRAFGWCTLLEGIYFKGNAPGLGSGVFGIVNHNAIVYYLPGAVGWGTTFGGLPTVLWQGWRSAIGPTIKANGELTGITVNRSENVSITVAMNAGPYVGVPCDWWIVVCSGSSWFYLNSMAEWTQEGAWQPVYQGGLFNLPTTEVLNITGLPVGSYTFWFVIDNRVDGILDVSYAGSFLFDSVEVNIQ